jgi:hypothetical protein
VGAGGITGYASTLPEIVNVIVSPGDKLANAVLIRVPFKSVSLIYKEDTYNGESCVPRGGFLISVCHVNDPTAGDVELDPELLYNKGVKFKG